jgi:hypothetical protein
MSDENLSIEERIQALLPPRTMPVQIMVVPKIKKSRKNIHYIGDGVEYATMEQAAVAHGITREAVRQRIKGSWWHWFKVVDGVPQPKVIHSIDKTTFYYKKKNGIKVPIHKPKKYKPRIKTMTPYNFNRINNLQKPKEIREILDDIFAKKDAKKSRKTLDT